MFSELVNEYYCYCYLFLLLLLFSICIQVHCIVECDALNFSSFLGFLLICTKFGTRIPIKIWRNWQDIIMFLLYAEVNFVLCDTLSVNSVSDNNRPYISRVSRLY